MNTKKTIILLMFPIFWAFFNPLLAQISDEELSKKQTWTVWLQAMAHKKDVYKLDLSGGAIQSLSPDIKKLKRVQKLYLEENDLTSLPEEICELKNLQILHIQRNNISKLPLNIGKLVNLKELNLGKNPIPEEEIERVQKLLPNCNIIFVD